MLIRHPAMATFDTRPPRRTSKEKLAPTVLQEAVDWYKKACAFHESAELEQAVSAYSEALRRISDFYEALDFRCTHQMLSCIYAERERNASGPALPRKVAGSVAL